MTDDTRFYIDGAWVDRADAPRIAVRNPYSEEVVGHIAAGSAADVDLAVAAARRAFASFSRTPVEERRDLLIRIRDLLEERSEQFAQAIVAEMGAAILRESGARTLRWGPPRSAMTMDYRQDRVNIMYDDAYKITQVSCG